MYVRCVFPWYYAANDTFFTSSVLTFPLVRVINTLVVKNRLSDYLLFRANYGTVYNTGQHSSKYRNSLVMYSKQQFSSDFWGNIFCKKDPRWSEELDHFGRESQTSRSPLQGRRRGRERRCGAQVVFLALQDAHNNSRRWLTPHRQNYQSDMDHLRPANSLVIPDRRENMRTSTPSDFYDSSFWRNNLLTAPSCRRVIETKSGQGCSI